MIDRRNFLTLAASVAMAAQARSSKAKTKVEWPIAIFEKVFEGLTYVELAKALEEIGADGVEATIRPGGHIDPAVATAEIPKMQQALGDRGKRIIIAATHIRSVHEPATKPLLEAIVANGITHYRMGHYHYDLKKPLKPQLDRFAEQAAELAELNQELGIQGLYQNHSGSSSYKRGYVGALGWDAAFMLDKVDPDGLGMAMDTRHLRKDTGASWRVALQACKPHIRSIYVKDGVWKGERGDEYEDVPLDTGFVNKQLFTEIRAGLDPMPLCIHMEWLGYRVFKKHEIPKAIQAHVRDITTLNSWMH